jgi:hypothetical protein
MKDKIKAMKAKGIKGGSRGFILYTSAFILALTVRQTVH